MYASYFGLREAPFSVTPDPRFFFANASYEEAYATLRYAIRERKGFVLLAGDVGTGKTTLLRRLMAEIEGSTPFVFVFNPSLPFDEILSFTCSELGLDVSGDGQLARIQALNAFLLELQGRGATAALLLDEAQALSDDALERLRLLSNLETAREKLLQIVLVGQPELEAKIAKHELRQLRERITLRCRIDGLSASEVGAFIQHRLRSAGTTRDDIFTRSAIRYVARISGGVPRRINVICDNAMLIAYGSSSKVVTSEMVGEAARDLRLGEDGAVAEASRVAGTSAPRPDTEPPRHTAMGSRWRIASLTAAAAVAAGLLVPNVSSVADFLQQNYRIPEARLSSVSAPAEPPMSVAPPADKPSTTVEASDAGGALPADLRERLRPVVDGTLRLTVARLYSRAAANRLVYEIEHRTGLAATNTPLRGTGGRTVHQVEIIGLRDIAAAVQAWQTVSSRGLPAVPGVITQAKQD